MQGGGSTQDHQHPGVLAGEARQIASASFRPLKAACQPMKPIRACALPLGGIPAVVSAGYRGLGAENPVLQLTTTVRDLLATAARLLSVRHEKTDTLSGQSQRQGGCTDTLRFAVLLALGRGESLPVVFGKKLTTREWSPPPPAPNPSRAAVAVL